jgi:hypothetical protein
VRQLSAVPISASKLRLALGDRLLRSARIVTTHVVVEGIEALLDTSQTFSEGTAGQIWAMERDFRIHVNSFG